MEDFYAAVEQNEAANDGTDIHLYFNPQIGLYTAFGVSAFLADHIIEGIRSYSEAFQKPVIIISPGEVRSLRNATNKVQHDPHRYYHLKTHSVMGLVGYVKWTNGLKKKA